MGRMEWSEGGEWDNCNSIINKYIFLKEVMANDHPSDSSRPVLPRGEVGGSSG